MDGTENDGVRGNGSSTWRCPKRDSRSDFRWMETPFSLKTYNAVEKRGPEYARRIGSAQVRPLQAVCSSGIGDPLL